ncbi:MAG TPA: hypothetical protein VGC87_16380 [Pyrinomonadaceae bacterium]|jgi:hypothetical protein
MMSTSLLDQQKLFGLFELDAAGNVLYSRLEPDGDGDRVAPDVDGRNFFEAAAAFGNAEELRRRVNNFVNSEGQAGQFHLSCQSGDGPLLVKVLLARISERSDSTRTKSILVHIRKV